jgi:DNA-3-methyladenine glycosylase
VVIGGGAAANSRSTHETPLPARLNRRDLPSETVGLARALIGKSLVHETSEGPVGVRIVETEAYPPGDPASRAIMGRTRHNAALFGGLGRVHVYLAYGVSWLVNIASEAEGVGAGVLFRAGEPMWGVSAMLARRRVRRLTDIANGPGKLAAALGIDQRDDDRDFFDGGPVWLGESVRPAGAIGVSVRIGLSKGAERPLRFYEGRSPFLSGPKALSPPP